MCIYWTRRVHPVPIPETQCPALILFSFTVPLETIIKENLDPFPVICSFLSMQSFPLSLSKFHPFLIIHFI